MAIVATVYRFSRVVGGVLWGFPLAFCLFLLSEVALTYTLSNTLSDCSCYACMKMSIHLHYCGSSIVIILFRLSGDSGGMPHTVSFILLALFFTAEFSWKTVIIAIIPTLTLVGISMYAWLAYEYLTALDHNICHTVSAVLFNLWKSSDLGVSCLSFWHCAIFAEKSRRQFSILTMGNDEIDSS